MSVNKVRKARVAETLRRVLADALSGGIKSHALDAAGMATVNHVDINSDLSVADIYISFFGCDEPIAERAIADLQRRAGGLRGTVGRKIGLKHAPELRFVHDVSPEFKERLANIVREDSERSVPDDATGDE
jgi:ribosome-binding factor A